MAKNKLVLVEWLDPPYVGGTNKLRISDRLSVIKVMIKQRCVFECTVHKV